MQRAQWSRGKVRVSVVLVSAGLAAAAAAMRAEDAKKEEKKEEKKEGLLEILKLETKEGGKAEAEPAAEAGKKKKEEGPAQAQAAPATLEEAVKAVAEKDREQKKPEEGAAAEGGADGKQPADKKAGKKKEPQPPMFRLRDGTRLAGTPDLKRLHIATPYGKLIVPIGEVVQVRFAAANDPELAGRLAKEIEALASEEFDRREEAMANLRKIGQPAVEPLKKAAQSDDEEVKTRAEKLLSELEEEVSEDENDESRLTRPAGEDDEVVTLKFTVLGKIEEDAFQLATRYGSLKLSRRDIVSVVFQDAPISRSVFTLPGGTFAGANKWFDTNLNIAQGEELKITASGSIQITSHGQTCGPEGTTNVGGSQLENFTPGSVVGRVGEKGKAFGIGTEYRGSAASSGKLYLGISLQQAEVSGNFQVEVERETGS
jgi:hypothetical protein